MGRTPSKGVDAGKSTIILQTWVSIAYFLSQNVQNFCIVQIKDC